MQSKVISAFIFALVVPVALQHAGAQNSCLEGGKPVPKAVWQTITKATLPSVGPKEAEVELVEVFDPNCPHCAAFHPEMVSIIERFGLAVRFTFVPIAIWNESLPKSAVLLWAAKKRAFERLLTELYKRQNRSADPFKQIAEAAVAAGLDPEEAVAAARDPALLQKVLENLRNVANAGVRSVPTVIINGWILSSERRSESGIGTTLSCLLGRASLE